MAWGLISKLLTRAFVWYLLFKGHSSLIQTYLCSSVHLCGQELPRHIRTVHFVGFRLHKLILVPELAVLEFSLGMLEPLPKQLVVIVKETSLGRGA